MSQAKNCSKVYPLPNSRECCVLFCFIKNYLLSWTEIPLERSANSPVQGERGTMTKKVPQEYFRTVLAGSFHLSTRGGKSWHLLQKAFQCMIDPSQRTPLFLLWHPSSFDALCRLLPFPFCLPAPQGITMSEQPSAHSRRLLAAQGGGGFAGSFSSPSSCSVSPFLNESWAGTGRAAAASSQLWLLLPSVPAGHMQQVQSQHEGRRETATLP